MAVICLTLAAVTRSTILAATPLVVWLGFNAVARSDSRVSVVRMLDPLHNVAISSYVQVWQGGVPVGTVVAAPLGITSVIITISAAIALGAWRAQRMDVR